MPNELLLFSETEASNHKTEKLILDFGDSFALDKYIQTLPFLENLRNVVPLHGDTLGIRMASGQSGA